MIRRPTQDDVPDLACIHVRAWAETYATLLPASEHAAHGIAQRTAQWMHQITTDTAIAYAPGLGFAQTGPQRDAGLAAKGYASELYAMYLLDHAKGTGLAQRLFDAVRPQGAFTALVLTENLRAIAFYRARGATALATRAERVGTTDICETIMAWG